MKERRRWKLQKIFDNCKKGKLTCGDDKKHCCDLMTKFMNDFNKKREEAKKNIKKLKFIEFK
jgi:tryptophanyl-tRNA synthetase